MEIYEALHRPCCGLTRQQLVILGFNHNFVKLSEKGFSIPAPIKIRVHTSQTILEDDTLFASLNAVERTEINVPAVINVLKRST
jgi:hypothetical protein